MLSNGDEPDVEQRIELTHGKLTWLRCLYHLILCRIDYPTIHQVTITYDGGPFLFRHRGGTVTVMDQLDKSTESDTTLL